MKISNEEELKALCLVLETILRFGCYEHISINTQCLTNASALARRIAEILEKNIWSAGG